MVRECGDHSLSQRHICAPRSSEVEPSVCITTTEEAVPELYFTQTESTAAQDRGFDFFDCTAIFVGGRFHVQGGTGGPGGGYSPPYRPFAASPTSS